jgi:hypothetical protein
MNFRRSNVTEITGDQKKSVENLRDELISQFKSIVIDTQKGLEQV